MCIDISAGVRNLEVSQKLSKVEFENMLTLLKRHVETDMDQWALWKFNTKYGSAYIDISFFPSTSVTEGQYVDLSDLVKND
jgi:hypothetical protein